MNKYQDLYHPDLLYELVDWDYIKDECKYQDSDNNNGLIYGIHWLDDNGEVCDAEWFRTEAERYAEVKQTQDRLREAFGLESEG